LPTRKSLWSGQYTLHDPEKGWGPLGNPDDADLLTILNRRGVATTLISDCPYLNDPEMGFTQVWSRSERIRGSGYDNWSASAGVKGVDCTQEPGLKLPSPDEPACQTWKERWNQLLRNIKHTGRLDDESQSGVAKVVTKAVEILDQAGQGVNQFLWLDIFSPHGPWDLPEKYRDYYATEEAAQFEIQESGDLLGVEQVKPEAVRVLMDTPGGWIGEVISDEELQRLRKTYAGAVTMLDTWVGRFLDYLEESGRLENSVLIFLSDQGEPLGEHGFVRRPIANVYEELAHTPLIVRWPGIPDFGQRRSALVQSPDIAATVLDAFGETIPPYWHGRSLRPLLLDSESKIREFCLMGMDCEIFAIRTDEWLYIEPVENQEEQESGDLITEEERPKLFAKPEDRWDQNTLLFQHEETVEILSGLLQKKLDQLADGDIAFNEQSGT
ncbi:MAG: hypothetical protein RJA81_402, partial [Planctomycetota bacterium]